MGQSNYSDNVFINCPFDEAYKPLFYSIVFTIFDCGFVARCALEMDDASQVRINKICDIISQCKYGIHDISRTKFDKKTKLPRFNMPLELGLFLGAKRFGDGKQDDKVCLILDSEPHRYQKFISNIAGQDIRAHNNQVKEVIKIVRNWLRTSSRRTTIPGGKAIFGRYKLFRRNLPSLCKKLRLEPEEMVFNDYTNIVYVWLKENG